MIFNASFVALAPNKLGRDLFVGDLRGQWDLLQRMLELVSIDVSRDRLIAVGNVIGKGTGSERILDLIETEEWFLSVRGQDEHLMVAAAENPELADVWAEREFAWHADLSSARKAALNRIAAGLPAAMEVPLADGRRVGVVHAEVFIGAQWRDVRKAMLTDKDAAWTFPHSVESALMAGYLRCCSALTASKDRVPAEF